MAGARETHTKTSDDVWPYGPLVALALVPVLWLAVGAVLMASHELAGWPTADTSGGLVYVVTAIGLIPVVLLMVDLIARRRGVLQTTWFTLDLRAADVTATRAAVTIETGLGSPGVPVTSSSVAGVHHTLNQARTNDINRIDLGDGTSWWITRLFALCAGASAAGAPHRLVFVGRHDGVAGAYLGHINPRDAYRLLRAQRPVLGYLEDQAQAIARYLTTVGDDVSPPDLPQSPDPQVWVSAHRFAGAAYRGLGGETALRVLLELLGDYETARTSAGVERVSAETLPHLFGYELQRQAIDLTSPAQDQVSSFLSGTDDPVAFVEGGRLNRIVDRHAIHDSLLRQLIEPPAAG